MRRSPSAIGMAAGHETVPVKVVRGGFAYIWTIVSEAGVHYCGFFLSLDVLLKTKTKTQKHYSAGGDT